MTNLRRSYLGQAWLVLLLSLVFGSVLAAVHVGLSDRIEANLRAETLSRIPLLVLGSPVASAADVSLREERIEVRLNDGTTLALEAVERQIEGHQVFEVIDRAAEGRLGWVARGAGPGYADRIELLIGLDRDASEITGLYVLSQKETPALGDGITKEYFRSRFAGAPATEPLAVTKDEGVAEADPSEILALSAATISSQSVCDIVNRTVADIRAEMLR